MCDPNVPPDVNNLDSGIIPPPEPPNPSAQYHLRVIRGKSAGPISPARSVTAVQAEMLERMQGYCHRETVDAPLLICTPPGVGKTHAGVQVAQEQAMAGRMVLWASQRRNSLEDIQAMEHYRPELWYAWLTVTDHDPQTGLPICRFADEQKQWTSKGYPVRSLCDQRCEKYQERCPLLNQAKRVTGKIIAARHQHLVLGIDLPKFDLVIIDELPLHAIVEERVVPPDGLLLPYAPRTVQNLSTQLIMRSMAAKTAGEYRIAGRRLIEPIYALLLEVIRDYEASKSNPHRFIKMPPAETISSLPYHWVEDAIMAFAREVQEYQTGADRWAERIWLSPRGLHLLRHRPLSGQLPPHCIILDASGDPQVYAKMLGKEPEVYAEQVERKGRLYQYTRRTNGKSRLSRNGSQEEGIQDTQDLIAQVRDLIRMKGYQKPGIICHLATQSIWEKEFPNALVLHFGGLRGSNAMTGCDGVFVVGVSGLDPWRVVNIATALDDNRRLPFGCLEDSQNITGLWTHQYHPYRLTEAGLAHLRQDYGADAVGAERLVGCYADPDLDAVSRQFREAELVQAIHRARLVRVDCDLWLMTAVPTDEPVDWVTDSLHTRPPNMRKANWDIILPELEICEQNGYEVTAQLLAQLTGVKESGVRKNCWLEEIAALFPEKWKVGTVPSSGGRPRKALIPLP